MDSQSDTGEAFDLISVSEMMNGGFACDINPDSTSIIVSHTRQSSESSLPQQLVQQVDSGDEDVEIVALSPKSMLSSNQFTCEVCGRGFPRFQNLQLHRKSHGLSWQEKNPHSRKRVYICPEEDCQKHNPCKGLKDLSAMRKHYCRRHGPRKFKCEKCLNTYAVITDLNIHSRSCGFPPIKRKPKISTSAQRLQNPTSVSNIPNTEKSPTLLLSPPISFFNDDKLPFLNSLTPPIACDFPFQQQHAQSSAANLDDMAPLSQAVEHNFTSGSISNLCSLKEYNFLQAVENPLKYKGRYTDFTSSGTNGVSFLVNQSSTGHVNSSFQSSCVVPTGDFLSIGQSSRDGAHTKVISNCGPPPSDSKFPEICQINPFIPGKNGLITDRKARDFLGLRPLYAGEQSDDDFPNTAH